MAAPTLQPVLRTTLSEQVAMQLASELAANRWKPGERLPSEAELCKAFRVGRSTLREALKSLAFIGLIRMRAGGGSYVAEQPATYVARSVQDRGVKTEKDVSDLCEARLLLEAECAARCAQHATAADLEKISRLVKQMKLAKEREVSRFRELDMGFHLAVSHACGNQVLAEVLRRVRLSLRELITKSLLLPSGRDQAYRQHQEILGALQERNPNKARRAMRAHLHASQREYKTLLARN